VAVIAATNETVSFLLEDAVDLKLTGKVALVTGSTAGIGFAIAQALASEGAHVYLNGRSQERVDAAVAVIRSQATTIQVDGIVADFSSSAGAQAVIAKLPVVDVLVNNVGIFEPKPFAKIPDEDWYRLFEINVMSGVRLARHSCGNAEEKLGTHPLHFQRVGGPDTCGNGSLWHDQNGAGCNSARNRGVPRRCRCHSKQ
jgi:NAD(P)-dependent dehydrogenase (short-subunit alcohol dehydrogenase family)